MSTVEALQVMLTTAANVIDALMVEMTPEQRERVAAHLDVMEGTPPEREVYANAAKGLRELNEMGLRG